MGSSCSSTKVVSAEDIKNKEINKELPKESKKVSIKILLLGTGESGKSTVFKQMRIFLHIGQFSKNELMGYRAAIYANTIHCMHTMIEAMSKFQMEFEDQSCEENSKVICSIITKSMEAEPFSEEVRVALTKLWSNGTIRKVYEIRNQYQLIDSAKYFLDNVDRISKSDYMPTEDDALRVRVQTAGLVEMLCDYKGLILRVIDVAGQRSERRKWIHHFDGVDCIIFVVALSEYDQMLIEDDGVNRMADSLEVFGSLCKEKWFETSSIIVFLNKMDLFMEKIKTVSLSTAFPDYRGSDDYNECVNFIARKFRSLADSRSIGIQETCATDKNQLQKVLDKVADIIIDENLKTLG